MSIPLNILKHTLRMDDLKGDPWGVSMNALFATAAERYMRGTLPAEWEFYPCAAPDPREEDNYWTPLLAAASDDALDTFGAILYRYTNMLRAAGRDY